MTIAEFLPGITEFLLTRIAEDEAWAEASSRQLPIPHSPPQSPARVFAECQAKREVVGHCAAALRDDGRTDRHSYHLGVILMELATVYADHPDYDHTWWTGDPP